MQRICKHNYKLNSYSILLFQKIYQFLIVCVHRFKKKKLPSRNHSLYFSVFFFAACGNGLNFTPANQGGIKCNICRQTSDSSCLINLANEYLISYENSTISYSCPLVRDMHQ